MSKTRNTTISKRRHSKASIRMSKLSRMIQSEAAKTNWTEMAKILFWRDDDKGRREMMIKLASHKRRSSNSKSVSASYTTEQMQYFLALMLILTIAEKRTQEAYQKDFSHRCDAISLVHGLEENQYWADGKVPIEWQNLDAEFEQRSAQILQDTLREYCMPEIADQVQQGGATQLFNTINNIEVQFLHILKRPRKRRRKTAGQ